MVISFIGQCTINLFKAAKYIFSGNFSVKNTLAQAAFIGYDSLGIALIIAFVAGAVLSLQVAQQFVMSGAEAYVGGLVSLAMIREMAPIFASLAIGARAGTAIAAEIGNMKVTEQIDAMKTLKVDPVGYLLVPRMLAGALIVPAVTIMTELIGIIGGMWVAKLSINLHPNRYITSVWLYTTTDDIRVSLIKAAIFGMLITLICATHGLNTQGGAKEVGLTTTKAAVWTMSAILIADYLLTWIFLS